MNNISLAGLNVKCFRKVKVKNMRNKDIRDYARINDVRLWQIAEKLNLQDSNFSRLLRRELTEDKKVQIKAIIDELAAGQ